jgi:hypothetical protein
MTLRLGALLVSVLVSAGRGLGAQSAAGGQTPAGPEPVTAVDVRIAHHLGEILATREAWNQTDHQNCAPTARSFGLYCALLKAQIDVTGKADHDAVIMNEARDIIDFVAAKSYPARLVNYNNDPATSFGDIQAFVRILENRLTRRLASPPASATPSPCTFTRAATGWTGSCGRVFGEQPEFALAPEAAITTGAWRTDARPVGVWAGRITNASPADAPVELEIYAGGTGLLRTLFGWFPVTNFQADPLAFTVDGDHEVPPNAVDRQILEHASAILSSVAVWDRHDTRDCAATATSWSIYCSVVRASVDLLGAYHHRRPAAQLVRAIIDERTKGKDYQHRLMDYNNDPTTELADVKSLFADALARIK